MVIGDPETLRRKARPCFGVGASVARSSTTAVRLPVLLSIKAAAENLGVCTKTVRRVISAGELPHTRIGNQIRIAVPDLCAYLARHKA
jgi:excisionase family DNA binding protein